MKLTEEAKGHTPAPWHTATTESDVYVLEESGHIVAICVGMQKNGTYLGEFEKQANAELIASAPTMLEELTALRAQVSDYEKALKDLLECYCYLLETPHPIPQNSNGSPIVKSTRKILNHDK